MKSSFDNIFTLTLFDFQERRVLKSFSAQNKALFCTEKAFVVLFLFFFEECFFLLFLFLTFIIGHHKKKKKVPIISRRKEYTKIDQQWNCQKQKI